MKPSVAIIILNWNGLEVTLECIDSIMKINYKNCSIVLVDNGSDSFPDNNFFKKYKKLQVVRLKSNLGFAEANNIGIDYAQKSVLPDYFLFLNNDTVVSPNFLSELICEAESNSKIGIVGPKIYYWTDKTKIWFDGGKIDFVHGPFLHMHQLETDTRENSKITRVDYINGCCMLVKKQVIEKIGKWDKDYFAYVEDIDFNIRSSNKGYESWIVPSSKIWHKVSYSSGGDSSLKKEYLKSRNLVYFWRKNRASIKDLTFSSLIKLKIRDIWVSLVNLDIRRAFKIILGLTNGFLNPI